MLNARIGRDARFIRCGMKQCGGTLATRTLVDPGEELVAVLPSIFVRHEDGAGVIWEEPLARRQRRLGGQRSEHHGFLSKATPDSPVEYMGRAMLATTDLPAFVRCPDCRDISRLGRELLV